MLKSKRQMIKMKEVFIITYEGTNEIASSIEISEEVIKARSIQTAR